MKFINDAGAVDDAASEQDAPTVYNTDTTGDNITPHTQHTIALTTLTNHGLK